MGLDHDGFLLFFGFFLDFVVVLDLFPAREIVRRDLSGIKEQVALPGIDIALENSTHDVADDYLHRVLVFEQGNS